MIIYALLLDNARRIEYNLYARYIEHIKGGFTMKFCEKCGKELLEGAKFCEGCGTAIETDSAENVSDSHNATQESAVDATTENVTNVETVSPVNVRKKIVLSKKSLMIIISIIVLLIIGGIVIARGISLNNYKEKLESAYSSITYGAERAESYASLESKVWRNCIYKQSSTETDKYTKNGYGLYYSDFNDALSNFYVGESLTYSAVASNVTIVDGYMSELKDCPKKFENEYKALKELYIAYSDITDLVVGNSSYSWNTFNETLESAKSDYKSALSSAKLLLE